MLTPWKATSLCCMFCSESDVDVYDASSSSARNSHGDMGDHYKMTSERVHSPSTPHPQCQLPTSPKAKRSRIQTRPCTNGGEPEPSSPARRRRSWPPGPGPRRRACSHALRRGRGGRDGGEPELARRRHGQLRALAARRVAPCLRASGRPLPTCRIGRHRRHERRCRDHHRPRAFLRPVELAPCCCCKPSLFLMQTFFYSVSDADFFERTSTRLCLFH